MGKFTKNNFLNTFNKIKEFFRHKKGYKFKCYGGRGSDVGFEKYIYKIISLIHSDDEHGEIASYLKIMRIFRRYDD